MLRVWRCGAILGGLLLVCSLNNPLLVRAEEDEFDAGNFEIGLDRGIELSELEYEDQCKPVADAEWKLLHDAKNPSTLEQWEKALRQFASFKKRERQRMNDEFQETSDDESSALVYKFSVIKTPGDALLEDADYEKLVKFVGKNRVLRATSRYSNAGKNLTREEVEYLLSHNGKPEDKLRAWATWHQSFSSQLDDFPSVLQLVQKAAEANDQNDAKSYWELLTGESDAYSYFPMQLDRLTELRQTLVNFTGSRLAKKYNLELRKLDDKYLVPAHLLGSLSGSDWTHLAFDVAPKPQVFADIRTNLWEKRMMGRSLYKVASSLGKRFLGQSVSPYHQAESDFWGNSNFRAECPGSLVSFCKLEKIRVSTCNEPSIANYLAAHKNVAKILLHQMSSKFPILNDVNRYSVMEEAVAELFSILAASPAWLRNVGLMNASIGHEEAKLASLTITALDVLPRLAYYRTVDEWRLQAIENNETDPKKLTSDWWKHRLQNEFTYSEDGEPPTFLSDDHVASNKPYLSKILGIVLAFQMYENIMKSTDIRHEYFDKNSSNSNLVYMVQNNSENWKTLINTFMKIDSISPQHMSTFFEELEFYYQNQDYDESKNTTYDYNAKEIELEQLEKRYRKMAATTTTSTTTTTTTPKATTTTTTTTFRSVVVKTKIPKSQIKDSLLKSGESMKKPVDKELSFQEDNEESPKVNTSKAVWVVAAVLVATVTICIIAIFGRRRCNRTPKNRRYV
ncbi:angiotensin-converting enzyme [Nasonia vitripennis]|uniref:Angiotensin-converting enzyme n=1 Tax=Nasonia vitripennis TaxID=7425 RepID=A0A7M7QW88_NASVI|nr:angiotensin-converting enzyme [Nasonia vitripennis]